MLLLAITNNVGAAVGGLNIWTVHRQIKTCINSVYI